MYSKPESNKKVEKLKNYNEKRYDQGNEIVKHKVLEREIKQNNEEFQQNLKVQRLNNQYKDMEYNELGTLLDLSVLIVSNR